MLQAAGHVGGSPEGEGNLGMEHHQLELQHPTSEAREISTWCRSPNTIGKMEVCDGENEGKPCHSGLSSTDRRRLSTPRGAGEGTKLHAQHRDIYRLGSFRMTGHSSPHTHKHKHMTSRLG